MPLDHIDLFLPPKKRRTIGYSLMRHFTRSLHKALLRCGKKSRLLSFQRTNPGPFVSLMAKDPPDVTLSFNGIMPDEKGTFLCDLIKIPHVAYLLDSYHYFLPLIGSKRSIVACHDQISVDSFKRLHFDNCFFMPYGIEKDVALKTTEENRPLDVVFIGRCIDYEKILKIWRSRFSKDMVAIFEEACRLFLAEQNAISVYEHLLLVLAQQGKTLEGLPGLEIAKLLVELELYVRGQDRIGLFKALKGINIDVFTPKIDQRKWVRLLKGDAAHLQFQEPKNYNKTYEVLGRAKIVLNTTPALKTGISERILSGLSLGAAVFSNFSTYVDKHFNQDDGVIIYSLEKAEEARFQLEALLANPRRLYEKVLNGKDKVAKEHTWDARVPLLCDHIEKIAFTAAM